MATAAELDTLRRATDIAAGDATYTDDVLNAMIAGVGIDRAAAIIWRQKAASFASMVDTTESGSSRKLSDLHKNALEMASAWDNSATVTSGSRSFTTGIKRV